MSHKTYSKQRRLWLLLIGMFLLTTLLGLVVNIAAMLFSTLDRGFVARYYDNPEWKGPPVFSKQENVVNLDTYRQALEDGVLPAEQFSIAWEGWLWADEAADYRFILQSDDGSSLMMNGDLEVDNGGYHGLRERRGGTPLRRGFHHLTMNYFNGAGVAAFSAWRLDERYGIQTPVPITTENILMRPPARMLAVVLIHQPTLIKLNIAAGVACLMVFIAAPGREKRSLLFFSLAAILLYNGIRLPSLVRTYHKQERKTLAALLSSELPQRPKLGTGENADTFLAAVRYLYAGRRIWLPNHDFFDENFLKQQGGFEAIYYYQQPPDVRADFATTLRSQLYHRFVFSYKYSGKTQTAFPAVYPGYLLLVLPEQDEARRASDLVVLPVGSDLYFVPGERLPAQWLQNFLPGFAQEKHETRVSRYIFKGAAQGKKHPCQKEEMTRSSWGGQCFGTAQPKILPTQNPCSFKGVR